ncbi:interferon gamma receptor 1 precursor [Takifugu rubripes]|uniref:Interferon gamma receptor 1-like n=1 Tax=Takifugu rubripes TaxID=31033 RepID=A0A3B5KRN7_TAKRU|nr:interferon gamma receptor 1 precursor [Takifugu rubripes]|eukprot:XP_011601321.1 PREDICTED: interferon gamma receptor 1 [Takifugu rubripes]
MRPTILYNAFLLFLWFLPTYTHVEPPTNVTFFCHNLKNLLQWSYDELVPGLRFRVEIRSLESPKEDMWVDPPALQANISLNIDPSDDNMLSVIAVVGQNESEPAPDNGITFSYSRESLVQQKCFLDFPTVNVNVDPDSNILFDFKHPWLLYGPSLRRLKFRNKKSNEQKIPEFSYGVKVNQNLDEQFECDTNVCKGKLPVDPGLDRHCLQVEGEMRTMFVRGSQEFCTTTKTHEKNKDIYIVVAVVIFVCVIAVAFIAFMLYKKMTRPSSFSPRSMIFPNQKTLWTLKLFKDPVIVPEVDPKSPDLLMSDETEAQETSVSSSTEPDLRLPLGMSAESEAAAVENAGGPSYMQGSELEAAAFGESTYERRPTVKVELAPGEPAEGYRH